MMHQKNFIDVFPGVFAFLKRKSSDDKKNLSTDMWVYLLLAHHFCLTKSNCIRVTYQEIENGSLMQSGLGFSRTTIREAISRLESIGLITIDREDFINQDNKKMTPYSYTVYLPNQTGTEILEFEVSENDPGQITTSDSGQILAGQNPLPSYGFISLLNSNKKKKEEEEKKEDGSAKQPQLIEQSKLPLFNKSSNKHKQTDKTQQVAEKLYKALAAKNKIMRRPSLVNWARHIKEWTKRCKVSHVRFIKVLNWYCPRIGKMYIPKAFSAQKFCERFIDIETAMENAIERRETQARERTWTNPGPCSGPPEEPKLTQELENMRGRSMLDKI